MILNTLTSTLVALSFIGVANAHPGESAKLMSRDDHVALQKRTIQAKTCQDATDLFMQNRRAKRGLHTKRSSVSSPSMVMTPELQEGPYYINNELVRDDVREDSPGIDLTFEFQILDLHTCEPLQNGFVEIWSANATGAYGGFGDALMAPPSGPDDRPGRRPGKVEPGQPGGPAGPQHPESGEKPKDHKRPHKEHDKHHKDHDKPQKDHDRHHNGHHDHHAEHGSRPPPRHNGDGHDRPRKGKDSKGEKPGHGKDADHHDHKSPDHGHQEHDHHEHGPPRHGPPREHGPHGYEHSDKHHGPKHHEQEGKHRHSKRSGSLDEDIMDLKDVDGPNWPGHGRPEGPGGPGGPRGPGGPGRGGPPMESNASFLRGGNVVGEDGNLTLITKWPGYYHGRCPHVHLLVHTDYEINKNGTLASKEGNIVHIGQMFFSESWNDEVFSTDGYEGNTNERTYNSEDQDVAALIAADYPPYVHVEMLGDDIYDGLVAYVTVVVDSSVQRQVRSKNYATTFTYDAPEATASPTGSFDTVSYDNEDEQSGGGMADMIKALADIPAQALRLWGRAE